MSARHPSHRHQERPARLTTEELIAALVDDLPTRRPVPRFLLLAAVLASLAWAGGALALTIGVRPDIATAAGTDHFYLKFAVTITLAATALALVRRSLSPGLPSRRAPWVVLIGPALLGAAVLIELGTLDSGLWVMAATGKNWLLCLVAIPALGIVPLGLIVVVLRRGAPTRPTLAGCYAGILAGGIAATAYALYCTDDSVLFMATCYTPAIAVLAALGATLGARLLRW